MGHYFCLSYQDKHNYLREAIWKKIDFFMEFFYKGSAPPPLIFGSYGTGGTHLILVTKKGGNKPPKNTQNGHI